MKFKLNKGFVIQKLDNRTVVFDGDKSVLYTFNDSASYIFTKIKAGWETERIIDQMVKKYPISLERAKKDFSGLVSDLKKKKILA